MKYRVLLSLVLIACAFLPLSGWAQSPFEAKRAKEPSQLFPIVPDQELVGAPDAAIPVEAMKTIHDRCLSKVPAKFTPDAHDYYCTCAAAATQGTMTINDIKDLQKEENREIGSKVLEKYVRNVVKPCMESPVEDIEYMFCIMYRKTDWRIRYPVPYCRCMSETIRENFEKNGEIQMMLSWGAANKKGFNSDPVESLWNGDSFQRIRKNARESCASSYMDPEDFR